MRPTQTAAQPRRTCNIDRLLFEQGGATDDEPPRRRIIAQLEDEESREGYPPRAKPADADRRPATDESRNALAKTEDVRVRYRTHTQECVRVLGCWSLFRDGQMQGGRRPCARSVLGRT